MRSHLTASLLGTGEDFCATPNGIAADEATLIKFEGANKRWPGVRMTVLRKKEKKSVDTATSLKAGLHCSERRCASAESEKVLFVVYLGLLNSLSRLCVETDIRS
jgi:hypothetical protein